MKLIFNMYFHKCVRIKKLRMLMIWRPDICTRAR